MLPRITVSSLHVNCNVSKSDALLSLFEAMQEREAKQSPGSNAYSKRSAVGWIRRAFSKHSKVSQCGAVDNLVQSNTGKDRLGRLGRLGQFVVMFVPMNQLESFASVGHWI